MSKQNSICSKYTVCLANPPFKGTVDAESINDGSFRALDRFRDLVKVISSKMVRHLEQEYRRLEWSRSLEDPEIRSREVGRKCRRIFYLQALLGAYGIDYPRAYY